MRRRKKIRDGLEDINITPVMDVVFLILIYFFVVGSNGFKNQIYKIKLPIASESPAKIGKDKYKSVTFISNNEILIDSNDKKVFTIKLHELDKYLSNKDEVLLSIDKNLKQIEFKVSCSKGTYIRSLCEDIGNKLRNCSIYERIAKNQGWGFFYNKCNKY